MAVLFISFVHTSSAASQSSGDIANAFNGLILSPVGALAPLARDYAGGLPTRTELDLRYGGWRFDINDDVHTDVAGTIVQRLGNTRTTISLTGAYLSRHCACAVWASGGAGLQSVLWSRALGAPAHRGPSAHLGIDFAVGGARYSGDGHATGYSASGVLDAGVATPFIFGTRLGISAFPGIGGAHFNSDDATGGGRRTLFGIAASWALAKQISLDAGKQRINLSGGPTVWGASLGWRLR